MIHAHVRGIQRSVQRWNSELHREAEDGSADLESELADARQLVADCGLRVVQQVRLLRQLSAEGTEAQHGRESLSALLRELSSLEQDVAVLEIELASQ